MDIGNHPKTGKKFLLFLFSKNHTSYTTNWFDDGKGFVNEGKFSPIISQYIPNNAYSGRLPTGSSSVL